MNGAGARLERDLAPGLVRRVWVEHLRPAVDGGRHPVKRVVGDRVEVEADILVDGHDLLAAVVLYRPAATTDWREAALERGANDVWRGGFTVDSVEPWEFTVEAWVDEFASWRDELSKKHAAGQELASELLEGAELVAAAAERADARDRDWLRRTADALAGDAPQDARVADALSAVLAEVVARWPDRSLATRFEPPIPVDVERERARFGAWYELFPRSLGPSPEVSGTFRDAADTLGYVADMGFDVVYLPPIHPIGRTNRKGANNVLGAGPNDPGSPWAIGAAEGGHTAVHPDLGTLEDFDALVAEARRRGLEIALDIAFQCSPDHPWVRDHPEWFRQRPDGTIKYAENPPKKYQDIHALDFTCSAWRSLWRELRDVMLFWAEREVRIFRVDNPHTKPIRFWRWAIAEVRSRYPDVVFLSEAFTRPKMMHALAKVGFSQSYTYFTWRNTKRELTDYVTELARPPVRDFMRPNFFVNTPDILPEVLQIGGRPAFVCRLVLAATLAASYGVYSGFELLEDEALPNSEEYRDSEKYQLRPRDWGRPDSLRELIAAVNAIRRDNPALHSNDGLRFLPVDNGQLLFYARTTPELDNVILVVVNLDPHHLHHGFVEVPIEDFGLGPGEPYQVHDLLGGGRYLWQGRRNYVRLDPASSPAQVYRLRRRLRTERNFDYFM
ncbi:MAG TPA: alpha-1,4-glucan--maltose-1-phosphate maltosyltransferase [Methylomirabilota bacterium]|nr:alpha-1,4-glucan--maltose-1-phosphate maltosyltransferase [Methylomirabilota bacterium]